MRTPPSQRTAELILTGESGSPAPATTARDANVTRRSVPGALAMILLMALAGSALAPATHAADVTPTNKMTTATLVRASNSAVKDSCFDCHTVMEGMSLVFTNDIHYDKGFSCDTCHGGDPTEPDQNISMNASRGFKVRVTRQGIPEYCGKCHADADFMGGYDPDLRVDQLAKYTNGVHGKLLAAGRKRSAECVDCHGVHQIRPPSEALSSASPEHISQTCGKCHADTAAAYLPTRHGREFTDQRRPGCTVCHSSHDTQPATTAMLTGTTSVCVRCHRAGTPAAKAATDIAQFLTGLEAAGPDSKDALARARVAVHSMSLAAVKRAAETAPPPGSDDK